MLAGGRVVGVWNPERGLAKVELFESLTRAQRRALVQDAERLGFDAIVDQGLAC